MASQIVTDTHRVLNPEHVEAESFRSQIQRAVDDALSTSPKQYTAIKCVLLSWQDDDLGFVQEVKGLADVLQQDYGFQCEKILIPSRNSYKVVRNKFNDYDDAATADELFIIYYGGHASLPAPQNLDLFYWTATSWPNSPSFNWARIQNIVNYMQGDTLLILDCCYAAHAANFSMSGKKEVLAASGWDSPAGNGIQDKSSFTAFLIEGLKHFAQAGRSFTMANLYLRMIMLRKGRSGRPLEVTPLHVTLNCKDSYRQIRFHPLSVVTPTPGRQKGKSACSMPRYPRMLISVSFTDKLQSKAVETVQQWLTTNLPNEVQTVAITVEAVFRSNSTLVIII